MDGIKIIDEKYIYLGSYPQNGTEKEPIKWRIIKNEDGVLTVITDKIMLNMDYDTWYSNYKNSTVRKYINNNFIPFAFTQEEQSYILDTELEEVTDKVFIPSRADIKGVCRDELVKKVTPYARSKKASAYPDDETYEFVSGSLLHNGWYWLRTPYTPPYDPTRSNEVYYIDYTGYISARVVYNGEDIGVVLMMRVKTK